jgi:hypothetical protein
MLVAPLLFALELAVLYVAGSNMMSHLIGISRFDGNGSVLGPLGGLLGALSPRSQRAGGCSRRLRCPVSLSGWAVSDPSSLTRMAKVELGISVFKLRSRKRAKSRRPIESADVAADFWMRDPLDWHSKNRLRGCSLFSGLRSVSACGQSLRPASHGSRCRCPHDGACMNI